MSVVLRIIPLRTIAFSHYRSFSFYYYDSWIYYGSLITSIPRVGRGDTKNHNNLNKNESFLNWYRSSGYGTY